MYLTGWVTSASSESVFSAAGNTVTNKRNNRLSTENGHNLVFLNRCHGVGWSLERNDAIGEMDKQEIYSFPSDDGLKISLL